MYSTASTPISLQPAVPDGIYCLECERAVDHQRWCSEHPRSEHIWASKACSVAENALKDALLGSDYSHDEVRLLSVDTIKATVVWRGNEEIGRRVTVEIFVSNESIRETL